MASPVIDASNEVFYLVDPDKQVTETCRRVGFRVHRGKCSGCPVCHLGLSRVMWTRDATCALVSGFGMTATAAVCVDRAKDRGKASRRQVGRLTVKMQPGLELRGFQRAAVEYSIACFDRGSGVLIADDMGLGKTIEAIATAVAIGATRVLVVCPASLRLNWVREIRKWTKQRAVELFHADDVFEGPGWGVTNAEKLVQRKALKAVEVVQKPKFRPALHLKNVEKLQANKGTSRAIWYGSDTIETPEGVLEEMPANWSEKDWAEREGTCTIVRAKTKGHALVMANSFDGWTHILANRMTVLAQQERAGGLYDAVESSPKWDLLIVDEAHRYGNESAINTRRVFGTSDAQPKKSDNGEGEETKIRLGLTERAKQLVALTGTPIPNRPKQILPLLRALSPSFRESTHFLMRYCDPNREEIYVKGGGGSKKTVWRFEGGSNLTELQARLRRECMIRRKKEDVLPELPPRTRQIIPVSSREIRVAARRERDMFLADSKTSEPALRALVAMACDNAFEFAEATDKLVAASLEGLVGDIATMRQSIAMAKLPMCLEHIENVLTTKNKVVVMAHHRAVVDALCRNLEGSVKLYGGMTDAAKTASVDEFQKGDARAFVGSLQAAGVGLTLTAADIMIFVEDDWVPSVNFQAEDRIHRIGQDRPVLIQHLVADGTIEAMIVHSVIAKQTIIDEALDSPKQMKRFAIATDEEKSQAKEAYAQWAKAKSFSDATQEIVKQIAARCAQRPPTNGEVSLWKRLKAQQP